jgi:prealbumin domain-containing protein
MPLFEFRRRSTRRRWMFIGSGTTLVAAMLLIVAAATAKLPGSTFEGNDGNLVVSTAGGTDWDNAPNLSVGVDLATGTGDNAFGQGAKEDNVNTTVVSGSIPNSKADLARFGVASEVINGDTFMYLAWSRENQSGTVNFDFELNAAAQPNLTTPGAKTLNRSVNDALINYSFQGGSQNPTLTRYHWNGSQWVLDGPISSTCSEGAINAVTVNDTLGGNPSVPRPPAQFGEAAINMTCAGIVPKNACEPFSSAYVKSRSSTSFTSEIKDFIAPVTISGNNCGSLTIIKRTDPRDLDQSFSYTATGAGVSNFSLNDVGAGDDASNTKTFSSLIPGQRTIAEDADPANFALQSITCTNSGGNTSSVSSRTATVNIVGGGSTTCVYVNKRLTGAIKVSKTTKIPGLTGPQPQAGVDFTVNGVTKATDANGEACFDGLDFGSYNVLETVPTGYQADQANPQSVLVDNSAKCSDSSYGGETVSFANSPLTDVTISVDSKADGGTASSVDCSDNSLDFSTGANGDGSKTSDIVAGSKTITCTIVIDP